MSDENKEKDLEQNEEELKIEPVDEVKEEIEEVEPVEDVEIPADAVVDDTQEEPVVENSVDLGETENQIIDEVKDLPVDEENGNDFVRTDDESADEDKEDSIDEKTEDTVVEEVKEEKTASAEEEKEYEIKAADPEPEEVNDEEEKKEVVREEKPKKKNKTGLKVLVVLLVLILLGVLGYAIYMNFKPVKNTAKSTSKEYQSDLRLSGNDLQDFDLYFLKLENKKANNVYSPLSIKYALEMLGEGANGESKKQIDAIIGDYKAKAYPNSNHMSFANAMFIRDAFKDAVKEDYTNNISSKYGAEVQYTDFSSAKPMNDWVNSKTFGLINNLFDDETVKSENFELVNALAIDMNWINRIQSASSSLPEGMKQLYYYVDYIHEKYSDSIEMIEDENYPTMKFNDIDNTKSVKVGASFNHYDIIKDKGEDKIRSTVTEDYKKYLKDNPSEVEYCPTVEEYVDQYIKDIDTNYKKADISTDYYISDNDSEKVFAKDLQTYDGITLQYVGIMPKKDDLSDYINSMSAGDINKIIKDMKEVKYDSFKEGVITQIKGNIPLFKYDYKLDLVNDLKKLEITDVFDANKADLSNMIDGEKQFINSANHSANIEFSNDGIKAAAATSFGGAGAAHACNYDYEFEVPVEVIDVTFDKPYIYIIRDKDSGEVWFAGSVYEPLKK